MKFTYQNVGNTILDGDGNGTFCFQPLLLQEKRRRRLGIRSATPKTCSNGYTTISYPGETGEMYINFVNRTYREKGNIRIVINSLVGAATSGGGGPNWRSTIWGGRCGLFLQL